MVRYLIGFASYILFVALICCDAHAQIIRICVKGWVPPCETHDVSAAIPLPSSMTTQAKESASTPKSKNAADKEADEKRFSLQINNISKAQLESLLSYMKADRSKINLEK